MLNHKFYILNADKSDKEVYIRISDTLIKKMKSDLLKYKFTWSGYEVPKYGLSSDGTTIKADEVNYLRECLMKQSEQEKEYQKFMALINKALFEKKEIIHDDGSDGSLVHDFIICDGIPLVDDYYNYKNHSIKIQDQFIMENYDVFKTVKMYWGGDTKKKGGGFDYYGITIISPQMARELLDVMEEFLDGNTSEKAKYFKGKEYDTLCEILNEAILHNKFVMHFGIKKMKEN